MTDQQLRAQLFVIEEDSDVTRHACWLAGDVNASALWLLEDLRKKRWRLLEELERRRRARREGAAGR